MTNFLLMSTFVLLPIMIRGQHDDAINQQPINLQDIENDHLRNEKSPYPQVQPLRQTTIQHFTPANDLRPNSFLQRNKIPTPYGDAMPRRLFEPQPPQDIGKLSSLVQPIRQPYNGRGIAHIPLTDVSNEQQIETGQMPRVQQLDNGIQYALEYQAAPPQQFVSYNHDLQQAGPSATLLPHQKSNGGFPIAFNNEPTNPFNVVPLGQQYVPQYQYVKLNNPQLSQGPSQFDVIPMSSSGGNAYKPIAQVPAIEYGPPAVQRKYVSSPPAQLQPAIVYGPPATETMVYGSPNANFRLPTYPKSNQHIYAPKRNENGKIVTRKLAIPYPPSFIAITNNTSEQPSDSNVATTYLRAAKMEPAIPLETLVVSSPASHHPYAPPSAELTPPNANSYVQFAPIAPAITSQLRVQPLNDPTNAPKPDVFFNRSAKSLIDSYIPSWVVTELQKPTDYPQHFTFESGPRGYDTIAYSVPSLAHEQNSQHLKQTALIQANVI